MDGQVPKPSVLDDLLGVSSEKEKNKCPKGLSGTCGVLFISDISAFPDST